MTPSSQGPDLPPDGVANTTRDAEQVVQARDIIGGVHLHGMGVGAFRQPRQLPREITHFTGREAELRKLDASLSRERPSAVVISAIAGAPGIGKTSLALHWAHRRQDRFPDGQLYVNLRGYDSGPRLSANHALESFLQALGLPHQQIPEDIDAKAGIYRSMLAGRRILVLLDNAATPDQIRPLLPNEPACLVLVTSRSRLSGLVARDGAHRISLDVLAPDEATTLLRDIIRDRADREEDAIAELARRCDYLPLALRIAAERVASRPHLTIAALVHELAAEHHRLDVLATDDDDEATTIRTVFSWSYHALSKKTAEVFRLLGLQPGPSISLEAAAALTGATVAQTQSHLEKLVSIHLLTETSHGRYQFHDLLRAYAAERVMADESSELRDEATQRLYEWYLHTAHAALFAYYPQHPEIPINSRQSNCRPLTFTDHEDARSWFITEYANLMEVVHHAAEVGQHAVGWQLPNAIDCYIGQEHPIADQIVIHKLGLAAAQHLGNKVGERWAYNHLGEALAEACHYEEAISCHQKALEIARKIGDKFGEGAPLVDLANIYNQLARYTESLECGQEALTIFRTIGHQRNECLSLLHIAAALHGVGKLDQASIYIKQGLDLANSIEAVGLQGRAMRSLAKIYCEEGRLEDAVNCLNQAAAHYRAVHVGRDRAQTLNELGTIHNNMGSTEQAREAWHEAIAILTYLDPHEAAQIRAQINMLDPPDDIH